MRELPKFKGYVVDERLREFRKIVPGEPLEFIPFDNEKGQKLLEEMKEKKGKKPNEYSLFVETCDAMGGKYEEEYGSLEPDVGGEFLSEHEAMKQWCSFENMQGIGRGSLIVFNAPGTFSIRHQDDRNKELFNFWDNDIDKKFNPEKQKMCFFSRYGIRVPKCDICVSTYPHIKHDRPERPSGVWLKLEPR